MTSRTPMTLDTVRTEIEALDSRLVQALLDTAGSPCPSPPVLPPPDAIARQFPRLWERACGLCGGTALSILWDRVSSGARVAEAKRRAAPDLFADAIRNADRNALWQAITHTHVEERVVGRAVDLARQSSRDDAAPTIGALFRDHVIPMTKEIQIGVLLAGSQPGGTA